MTSKRYSRRIHGLDPLTIEEEKETKEEADLVTYSRFPSDKLLSGYFNKYNDDSFDIYRGEYEYDTENRMIRSGEGQMIYENGVIYEGTWMNNKPKHVKIYIKEKEFSKMVVAWMGFEDEF